MIESIKIHGNDNVFVALTDDTNHLRGHKYAEIDIIKGARIIKYGEVIGTASKNIKSGDHVHIHNITTTLNDIDDYTYSPEFQSYNIDLPEKKVNVYERSNGQIGIRNEIWIVPTVGCVNGTANAIIKSFEKLMKVKGIDLETLPYLDGIYAFPHNYGCSQMGDDHLNTLSSLQNIVKHPNAGGVLVLGLGCENNQVNTFFESMNDYDQQRIRSLISQDVTDEIEDGCDILEILLKQMATDSRTKHSISVLNLGLECGGSDGLSGITANPLLGLLSDYMAQYHGTTVLTEVPELFGAEHLLMNRCINKSIFNKTIEMINSFKDYYKSHNQVIYENPSPGNKAGGITTLEDKSLGCTTKSGQSPVMDVLKHTDRLKIKGLNLISAPGNDLVATTTLGMCGCHMVLFTTGRGTPFGGFIPTYKISTNHPLAVKKPKWIDFDAGRLTEGIPMISLLEELIEQVVNTANGQQTRQEENGYREIAIFKSGVTL